MIPAATARSLQLTRLATVRNVALIRLDEFGDLVLISPLLRELRRNLPKARISLAINPAWRNLVEFCPYVNRVIDVPRQIRGGGKGELGHLAMLVQHAARDWWPEQHDLAILPRYGADLHGARLLACLIGAHWRVGFNEENFRNQTLTTLGLSHPHLMNQRLARSRAMHEVSRNLGVLQSIGGTVRSDALEVWTTRADERLASELSGSGARRDLIAINPWARTQRRTWPISRFAEIIDRLTASAGAHRIVVIGGPSDRSASEILDSFGPRLINLTGKLTLRQTAAMLRRCRLYIGGDTGPMHLAAAAGASVVEISCHPIGGDVTHENSPARFGPWKTPAIVLQPAARMPCVTCCESLDAHCILGVSANDVVDAANRLLEGETAFKPSIDSVVECRDP
jgi:ADP-heptose:LPS heptosyltransferase